METSDAQREDGRMTGTGLWVYIDDDDGHMMTHGHNVIKMLLPAAAFGTSQLQCKS
jgi:hypothetical protein